MEVPRSGWSSLPSSIGSSYICLATSFHSRTWGAPAMSPEPPALLLCNLKPLHQELLSGLLRTVDDPAHEHLLNQLLPPFLTLPQTDTAACFLGWHPRHTVPPVWGSVGLRYQRLVVEIGSTAFMAHLRGGKKSKSMSPGLSARLQYKSTACSHPPCSPPWFSKAQFSV